MPAYIVPKCICWVSVLEALKFKVHANKKNDESHELSAVMEDVMPCRAYSPKVKWVTIITNSQLALLLLLYLVSGFLNSE
jgi:hypothetical protein